MQVALGDRPPLGPGDTPAFKAILDIVDHPHPGEHTVLLEDHAALRARAGDGRPPTRAARGRQQQAGHHLQKGGLAAAGRADQADELAARDSRELTSTPPAPSGRRRAGTSARRLESGDRPAVVRACTVIATPCRSGRDAPGGRSANRARRQRRPGPRRRRGAAERQRCPRRQAAGQDLDDLADAVWRAEQFGDRLQAPGPASAMRMPPRICGTVPGIRMSRTIRPASAPRVQADSS